MRLTWFVSSRTFISRTVEIWLEKGVVEPKASNVRDIVRLAAEQALGTSAAGEGVVLKGWRAAGDIMGAEWKPSSK